MSELCNNRKRLYNGCKIGRGDGRGRCESIWSKNVLGMKTGFRDQSKTFEDIFKIKFHNTAEFSSQNTFFAHTRHYKKPYNTNDHEGRGVLIFLIAAHWYLELEINQLG